MRVRKDIIYKAFTLRYANSSTNKLWNNSLKFGHEVLGTRQHILERVEAIYMKVFVFCSVNFHCYGSVLLPFS